MKNYIVSNFRGMYFEPLERKQRTDFLQGVRKKSLNFLWRSYRRSDIFGISVKYNKVYIQGNVQCSEPF